MWGCGNQSPCPFWGETHPTLVSWAPSYPSRAVAGEQVVGAGLDGTLWGRGSAKVRVLTAWRIFGPTAPCSMLIAWGCWLHFPAQVCTYLLFVMVAFVHAPSLNCVRLFVTSWTVAHQAPLSMGFPGKNAVALSSSGGFSWPRARTWVSCVSCIGRWILYHWAIWEAHK